MLKIFYIFYLFDFIQYFLNKIITFLITLGQVNNKTIKNNGLLSNNQIIIPKNNNIIYE